MTSKALSDDSCEPAIRRVYRPRFPDERRSVSRSATRAFDLLELFGRQQRSLRASEIAMTLHLQPSTVHQLLKSLVESAHLTFDAKTKAYLPSHRLTKFSAWFHLTHNIDLPDLVSSLHDVTGEFITLSTPCDLYMQVIDFAGGVLTERGLRASMFGSAIGGAYLSTVSNAEFKRLMERGRIPQDQHRELLMAASGVRRLGYAQAVSSEGILSIAMPLPASLRSPPVVIGLGGEVDRERLSLPRLVKTLFTGIEIVMSQVRSEDHDPPAGRRSEDPR